MSENLPTDREFAFAVAGFIVLLTFMNWGVFNFVKDFILFFVAVGNKTKVEPTSAAALPMLVGGVSLNFFAVLIAFKFLTKEKYTETVTELLKLTGAGCVLGAVLILTNPIVHYGLNSYAQKHGYHVCPTKQGWKWMTFRTEYVLDPKHCRKH